MNNFQEYWRQQKESKHRFSDERFYKSKAKEHASLMEDEHKSSGSIDLGCGAGELLEYLLTEAKVETGVDFSSSMLEVAEKRLSGRNIKLINADLFAYLPAQRQKVWIACGSVNQYLDIKKQREFLDLFANNQNAEALYLFDCVDPIRYSLLSLGIGYIYNPPTRSSIAVRNVLRSFREKILRLIVGMNIAVGFKSRVFQRIGRRGEMMGYGFLPKFWINECRQRDLRVEIVSSRYYEYRYHVLIKKRQ